MAEEVGSSAISRQWDPIGKHWPENSSWAFELFSVSAALFFGKRRAYQEMAAGKTRKKGACRHGAVLPAVYGRFFSAVPAAEAAKRTELFSKRV